MFNFILFLLRHRYTTGSIAGGNSWELEKKGEAYQSQKVGIFL